MPTFQQIQDSCIKRAVNYVGEEFEFKGQIYKGVIAQIQAHENIESGGYRPVFALTIYVNKNGFPVPNMGDRVTARDQLLIVKQIATDAISYTITVQDIY